MYSLSSLLPERHSHMLQQRQALGIGLGCGCNRNIHSLGFLDFVVVDLGKNQLILQAQRVVAASVKRFGRHAGEIAHTGQSHVHQAVQKLVHTVAPQRDHGADRHAFAQLESSDGFLGLGNHRFLPGDRAELVYRAVHELGVLSRFAETDIYGNLLDLGHTHDVLVAEFLHQGRDDAILVHVAEASIHLLGFFGSFWLFIRLRFFRGSAFGHRFFPRFFSRFWFLCHSLPLRSLVHGFAGFLGDANTARRRARPLHLVADSRRCSARGENHDVRDRNRAFLLGDPALDLLGWIGAGVARVHRNAFHQNSSLGAVHRKHTAGLIFVAPRHHFHLVVFLDLYFEPAPDHVLTVLGAAALPPA